MITKAYKQITKDTLIFFIFLIVFNFCIPIVLAQGSSAPYGDGSFGISPPYFKLEGHPGETINTFLTLDNSSDFNSVYTFEKQGVIIENNLKKQIQVASLTPSHIARNMKVEVTKVILPPHSNKQVRISIKVAETLKGSQYASITVSKQSSQAISQDVDAPEIKETRENEFSTRMGVGVIPAMGIGVRVNVLGTLKYSHAIPKLEIEPQTQSKPLKIRAFIQNTGNAEFGLPFMLVLLKYSPDTHSRKVVARTKSERAIMVLPGTSGFIDFMPILRNIEPGTYQAVISGVSKKIVLPPTTLEVVIP